MQKKWFIDHVTLVDLYGFCTKSLFVCAHRQLNSQTVKLKSLDWWDWCNLGKGCFLALRGWTLRTANSEHVGHHLAQISPQ